MNVTAIASKRKHTNYNSYQVMLAVDMRANGASFASIAQKIGAPNAGAVRCIIQRQKRAAQIHTIAMAEESRRDDTVVAAVVDLGDGGEGI